MKNAALFHVFAAVSILVAIFQPIDATPPDIDEPALGNLVINLVGSDGASLGGACFDILHADGVESTCDDDGDGSVTVSDLPAGDVTVRQSSSVAGYAVAPEAYGTIPDGDTGYVTLTAQVIPPEPTVEPTAVPTEVSSEESEDNSQPFARAAAFALDPGSISIDCDHTTGSPTTDFVIEVGDYEGDTPFSITVTPYDLEGNALPPITFTESPVELPDEEWRRIEVDIQFSNGQVGSAVAGCNSDPIDVDITTTPYVEGGDAIPDGGGIDPGTPMYDTAELAGQSVDAGGTVTYYLYDSADCSGEPVFTSGPKDVVNGEVPDSDSYTPNDAGVYQWVVVYSGDLEDGNPTENSNFNGPAESGCGEETVIVGEVETDISTVMQTANGDTIPQGSTIPLGTDVQDTADLNGALGNAGGTVTYSLYSGECPGTLVAGPFVVDVANGQVPNSPVVSDLPQGTYNWVVEYSGDDQNSAASSECGEETFTVGKAEPAVTTTMYDSDNNLIEDGGEVPVGTSMYDTAQIDDSAEPLTGTVTYALYDSANCDGEPVAGPFEVTIGEDGTIPPSPDVTLDTVGTFNWVVTYSGDDQNEAASSDCGSETVNVTPTDPTIVTEIFNAVDDSVVNPGSVIPDDSSVYDTATIDGLTPDATGTVTFSLYNNYTCAGEPYFTVTVPLNSDGTVPPTPDVGPLPGGTWNWTASYSGDDKNNPASTSCGDEEFFVGQGQGGISTMVEDTNGVDKPDGSTVTVDTILRDTAVLDGVTPNAGGTVTFYLFQGTGQDCDPLTDAIFTSAPVPVVNGVVQGPSGTFIFENQGTYEWVAVYSGDNNNASVSSPCGAETIVVVGKPSSVATTMYVGETELGNNERVLAGTPTFDTAVVTPDDATGTLTYALYNNANCSGNPIELYEGVPLGDPSPSVTLTVPGIYNWVVTYSGDADYAPSVSACSSETFYIALQPTITTKMVDENNGEIANNSTIQAGEPIGDTAVLTGATSNASGTVTYNFYHSADCSGTPVFAPTVTVTNGAIPPSGTILPPFIGEWSIQAIYSGNNTNFPAKSECGTENFTLDPETEIIIRTEMRSNGQVIADDSQIRYLPASVTDTLIILGLPVQTTGDVTFELFKSTDCSGTPVQTFTYNDFTITPTNLTLTTTPFTLGTADWGTYNWVVTVSGDLTNDGIPETVKTECGEETFTGVTQNPKNVNIRCTYNASTQLSTFQVLVSKPTTADPDIDPNLVVVATPTDNLLNPLTAITYHAYDSSNPASGVNFVLQSWRQLSVQITWPDGTRGSAVANCNTTKLNPDIFTEMFVAGNPATEIEQGGTVVLGDAVYDTTQLVPGTGTVTRTGSLTYTLYRSADCATGTNVFGPQVFTLNGPTFPPSANVVVNQPGTYNWVVSYSGDQNNNAAVSACGEETFVVEAPDIEVVKEAGSESVNAGDDVSFTITVTNIGEGLARDVELNDTLPAGIDWSIDPVNESCTLSGLDLTCDIGDMDPDDTFSVTVTGTTDAADCGVLENSASADATNEPDDVQENNTGSAEIAVNCPDLEVIKEAANTPISAGDNAAFTITLSNIGEGTAYDVTLEDELPEGIDWVIDPAVDGCAITDGILACSFDSLEPGSPVSITVTGETDPTNCGVLVNTVTVEAANEVPESGPARSIASGRYGTLVFRGEVPPDVTENNSSTAYLDIDCPGILVEKDTDTPIISAGDEASYTITISNPGGEDVGTAYNVELTDTLPAGIEWAIDPANEACEIADDGVTLTCDIGTLEPDDSFSVTVVGQTDAADCGLRVNIARGTASNEPEGDEYANEDSASILIQCPDVIVEKSTDTPVVSAGDDVSFSIVVTNPAGVNVGTAYDVELTDTLPAGIEWTIDPANEACTIAGDGVTLTCDIGTMEPGDVFTVSVVGTTDAPDCGVLTNTASIEASNEDEEAAGNGNSSTATISVLCPDVIVEKSTDTPVVSASDEVGFTIVVTNPAGENVGNAYDVVLTDTLPAGIEWTIDPANEACSIADDGISLTCDIGTMAPGDEFSVTVVGPTDPTDCGTLENTASADASNEAEGDLDNNADDASIEVLCPDIEVLKEAAEESVSAADEVSFTITVNNIGDGRADNVVLTDTLPAGVEWVIEPENEACAIADDGVTLTCDIGTMESGDTFSVTVVGPTDPTDCGTLENTASADASNEAEEDLANNSDDASIDVLCPDIEVLKSAAESPISSGDQASFTITVSNLGEGNAYDVVVTDDLPDGVSWSIDPAVDGCSITGGTLTCDFGTMAPGDTIDITVVGTTDAADCGLLENLASAEASNEAEGDLDNNEADATIEVLCPDLAVEKTAAESPISAGDEASFTITVSNIGEGNAYDVVVTDVLPTGVEWAIDPAVEGCAIADGTLTCEFDTLAPGASVDITVVGTTDAADCGTLLNTVTVEASNETPVDEEPVPQRALVRGETPPSVTDNNTDSAEIDVLCPDLEIEKTAADTDLMAGDQVSFTITVTNLGEGNAYDVVVTDELPAGLNWRVTGDAAGSCDVAGGNLVCTFATLAPGESVDITVVAPTTTSNCTTLVNTVSVEASNEPEAALDNNEAEAEATVTCPPPGSETPISVLPVTGSGAPASGSMIPLWGQVAAAMLMLLAAAAVGTGSIRSRRKA